MTGTAQTEAAELHQIYKLGVVSIPTNRPMLRTDQPDLIYKTEEAKFAAVAADIAEKHRKGQPVLVGTTSVEKSEYLSKLLRAACRCRTRCSTRSTTSARPRSSPRPGTPARSRWPPTWPVAVPTSCSAATPSSSPTWSCAAAGSTRWSGARSTRPRGTRSSPRCRSRSPPRPRRSRTAGGLYVLGTERHESRRIDNQLRGRSGRQGDQGESRFYLSLGDELMRRFNGQVVESIMNRFNLPDDVPIEAGMVTKAIRSAQTQVEQQNFEIRKNVLKYDEVLNKQRTVIYDERRRVLAGEDIKEQIEHMLEDVIDGLRRRRHRRGLRRGLGPREALDGAALPLPGRDQLGGARRGRARRPHQGVARRGGPRRRAGGVRPPRGRGRRADRPARRACGSWSGRCCSR